MREVWRLVVKQTSTLALLALVTGCATGDSGDAAASSSTRVDSAGVTIITSTGSIWGERETRIDSAPLIRIGSDDAGPYQFSFISRGQILADGAFAIAEIASSEIRIFDSAGQHLRTMGRRGSGPGEFQVISGLFATSGDSLTAYDQIQRRLTVFPMTGGAGRVVASIPVPGGRGNYDAFGAFGDGRLLLFNPGSGFRPDLEPGLQWVATEIVTLDPTDGATNVISRLPSREQFVLEGGDTRVHVPAHGAIAAATDSGFYWGTSDRYEIRWYDREGRLRRMLRRSEQPRPVEPAMISAWVEQQLDVVRRREGEAAVDGYRQVYADASHGTTVPLFETAFVDGEQRLWVGRAAWPDPQLAPRRWSVFHPDGHWLGDVLTPPQLRILDSRNGLVLGVWQEDGDAPFVQLHRIEISG